jgi:hypothetical protein
MVLLCEVDSGADLQGIVSAHPNCSLGSPMGPSRELWRNAVLENRELRGPYEIWRIEMPVVDITWELQNKIREIETGRRIIGNMDAKRVLQASVSLTRRCRKQPAKVEYSPHRRA